jgi:hypothetical protein
VRRAAARRADHRRVEQRCAAIPRKLLVAARGAARKNGSRLVLWFNSARCSQSFALGGGNSGLGGPAGPGRVGAEPCRGARRPPRPPAHRPCEPTISPARAHRQDSVWRGAGALRRLWADGPKGVWPGSRIQNPAAGMTPPGSRGRGHLRHGSRVVVRARGWPPGDGDR